MNWPFIGAAEYCVHRMEQLSGTEERVKGRKDITDGQDICINSNVIKQVNTLGNNGIFCCLANLYPSSRLFSNIEPCTKNGINRNCTIRHVVVCVEHCLHRDLSLLSRNKLRLPLLPFLYEQSSVLDLRRSDTPGSESNADMKAWLLQAKDCDEFLIHNTSITILY